jgi:phosphatidylglycerophosphate synthase
MVTSIGLGLGLACGVALAYREVPYAIALGLASVFCDLLDGAMARLYGLQSRTGLYLDSMSDRLTELAVVVGAIIGGIVTLWGAIAIIGSASLLLMRC